MEKYKNIEFWENRQGGPIMCENIKTGEIQPFLPEFKGMTGFVLAKIADDYPLANECLDKLYKHHGNFHYIKALRFLKCNFRENDKQIDVDEDGNMNLEDVHCPLKFRGLLCKEQGVICNPKLNTALTKREMEYIPHLISGMTTDEISNVMIISPFTVENTRKNIYRKLGFSGKNAIAQLATWANKKGILK